MASIESNESHEGESGEETLDGHLRAIEEQTARLRKKARGADRSSSLRVRRIVTSKPDFNTKTEEEKSSLIQVAEDAIHRERMAKGTDADSVIAKHEEKAFLEIKKVKAVFAARMNAALVHAAATAPETKQGLVNTVCATVRCYYLTKTDLPNRTLKRLVTKS